MSTVCFGTDVRKQHSPGNGAQDDRPNEFPMHSSSSSSGAVRASAEGDEMSPSAGQAFGRSMTVSEVGRMKQERIKFIVPRHYQVARKVVTRCMEVLDAKDNPATPGIIATATLEDMVKRFDAVFGIPQRDDKIATVIGHLKRHTRRRRGGDVVGKGFIEWEQTSRIYELFCTELNTCERIFFTVDVGESSAVLSKICSFFLIFMILISIIMWMVSTLPSVQEIPDKHEGVLCATAIEAGDCPPEPHELFKYVEHVCVITFTIEYLIRLVTVHSVRFALLDEFFLEAVLTGANLKLVRHRRKEDGDDSSTSRDSMSRAVTGLPDDDGMGYEHPQKLDGKLKTTIYHVTSFSNVIDLLAIVPYWLEVAKFQGGGGFLVVLRILRLTRIFRVFKLGKYNDVFTLFTRVINQSTPALLLMIFFICLGCCLFGTLVWFAEQGVWYPEGNPKLEPLNIVGRGAYLRHTGSKEADDLMESPFQSIIHSFWYVIVTITTVGYGDIYPTTPEGKVIAAIAILNGIIVLAMPIGVVGANFSTEYYNVLEDKKRRKRLKQQLEATAVMEEANDHSLKTLPDDDIQENQGGEALELNKIDEKRKNILGLAEALDTTFKKILPAVMYQELTDGLRSFLAHFLRASSQTSSDGLQIGKPKVQMAHLVQLDMLSADAYTAISFATDLSEASPFDLNDAFQCRQDWCEFECKCWEYASQNCLVEKRRDPPDYSNMKLFLAAKVANPPTGALSTGTSSRVTCPPAGSTGLQGPWGSFAPQTSGLSYHADGPGDGPIPPPMIPSPRPKTSPPMFASSSDTVPQPPGTQPQLLGRAAEAGPPESTVPQPEVTTGPDPPDEPPATLPGIPAPREEQTPQGKDDVS